MPAKKRNAPQKRAIPKKAVKVPEKKFVSKFLTVVQRFPESELDQLSQDEENTVNTFFVRLIHYTNGTKITFKPDFLLIAFMYVSFPNTTFLCKCNPFLQSLLHRSLDFVGVVFQVIIDCNESEDDGRNDFLPVATAENFSTKLNSYLEVLRFHYEFEKGGACQCPKRRHHS
jgi:hypothetical protein